MADNSGSDLIDFDFSKGVTEILNLGEEGWIDILSWDFKATGWIDILPWDFKANEEGDVFFKDVQVAEVQTNEDDGVWLVGLLTTLNDEGFF